MFSEIWGKLLPINTELAYSVDLEKHKVCYVIHLELTIGGLSSNDVQIKNPRIGLKHCLIEYLTDKSS
jgi:hypothetical protein